jgi:hypothetical protein
MADSSRNPCCPSRLVTCGRYDKHVSLERAADVALRRQARLWSKKPRLRKRSPFVLVATDGEIICHAGKRQPARQFLGELAPELRHHLLVLTRRELDLVLPLLVEFDASAKALEVAFPVFSDIKCSDSLERQLQTLHKNLKVLRKIGINGPTLSHQLVQESSYWVERSVRSKNGLDQFFALASPAPYQEVFKLREERPDRVVVALDFNSMYASCMNGLFPEPKTLRYRRHHSEELTSQKLEIGLYRVILANPNSEFFCNYHPLKFTLLGNSFSFRMERGQKIEVLLLENELLEYAKFFDSVRLVESITAKTSVRHPLAKQATLLYQQRVRAQAEGKEIKERALKLQIASLHSVTNRRRHVSKRFDSIDSAIEFASERFQLCFPDTMSVEEKLERLSRSRLMSFRVVRGGILARVLNHAAADALHAFSSRVIANARLKMISLLDRLSAIDGLEVCYVNTDCVHVSIERSRLEALLEAITADLSDEMGSLRVQCIADRGYWFEPGRYWLIRDGEVVKFANKGFNHPGATRKFLGRRRIRCAFRGKFVNFTVDKFLSIDRSFSYAKRLSEPAIDTQDCERYIYREVSCLEVAGDSVEHEMARSKGVKLVLFDRIATGEVSPTRWAPPEC